MRSEIKRAAVLGAGVVAVLSLTVAHPLAQAPATARFRLPGAAHGRRPSGPERHLASLRHREYRHPGSRGTAGTHPELMAPYGAEPPDRASSRATRSRISRGRWRRRKRTSTNG